MLFSCVVSLVYLAPGTRAALDQAVRHHRDVTRLRHDRADPQRRVASSDQEKQQSVAQGLLYQGEGAGLRGGAGLGEGGGYGVTGGGVGLLE